MGLESELLAPRGLELEPELEPGPEPGLEPGAEPGPEPGAETRVEAGALASNNPVFSRLIIKNVTNIIPIFFILYTFIIIG
jgi:hypothetical protein